MEQKFLFVRFSYDGSVSLINNDVVLSFNKARQAARYFNKNVAPEDMDAASWSVVSKQLESELSDMLAVIDGTLGIQYVYLDTSTKLLTGHPKLMVDKFVARDVQDFIGTCLE